MSKILLIEDYPVIQEMYAQVLKDNGFTVDVAADGNEALEKVKKAHYDVVLLDLLLPEVNGIDFLERFTDRGKTQVIVLSDFDYHATVEKAKSLGVEHYWTKAENTPHVLAKKLEEILGTKKKK